MAAMPCISGALNQPVAEIGDELDTAPHRKGQQQRGIKQRGEHAKPGFCRSVVGGFLVIGQLDFFTERCGHGCSMRGNMGKMAARQPQPGKRGECQNGYENKGELCGGHLAGLSSAEGKPEDRFISRCSSNVLVTQYGPRRSKSS